MDEDGGSVSRGCWKQNLYLLQEGAPRPKVVRCTRRLENRPPQYGEEFHGMIERSEAERLLLKSGEGSFLVRESQRARNAYTLCMFFNGTILNYKLFYDGTFFVGEKRFESMELLVADGLITMHVELHASEYIKKMADEAIYEDSPYSQHNKSIARRPVAQPHNFVQYTFKTPHYCDYCRNFLWGLVHQGVRCEDCGFVAHKKCSEKVLNDCRPEAKYVKRMFAVDITTLCLAHQTNLPPVVSACIQEVESRGLREEGIYRVSGSHEQMERLRGQYDSNHNVDLSAVDDIHTVCGLLKLYLRLLPQQLVPFSIYKQLLAAHNNLGGNKSSTYDRRRAFRKVILELSDANISTLSAILTHLNKVSQMSDVNKMTVENLATIFSPTLFCSGTTPALPQHQHQLLHFLILHPTTVPVPMPPTR